MFTVTPRKAETFEESSERRELFCLREGEGVSWLAGGQGGGRAGGVSGGQRSVLFALVGV